MSRTIPKYVCISKTYVDDDSRMVVEDGDLGVVRGNVAVELLLVVVPLHRVEVVPLQVVVALEHGLLALEGVRGDDRVLEEADAETACKKTRK